MPTATPQKLNPRLIIIHILAIYFLQQAFIYLAFLLNVDYLENMHNGSEQSNRVLRLAFLTNMGVFAGIGSLGGFLISLFIGIKRKWYWLNAVIAFVGFWLLTNLILADVSLSTLVWELGNEVGNLFLLYSVMSALMLSISLVLFFAKPVNRFIGGINSRSTAEELPESFAEHLTE